ncbi:MAG: HAD-IIB family hydrolase [Gammaproteobacteria bacterium]|nr:HAD-IIB family hydrolase [Gammaproteobacteria bacterium]
MKGLAMLRLQEPAKQNRFKISYYVPMHADFDELKQAIHERLAGDDVRCNLICSVDEPSSIGLLDILPQRAGKLHALRALMERLGFNNSNTVFCGDSGNDMEVLTSDIDAVLVANAMPEVRAAALETVRQNELQERLYLARGEFMNMNGNYSAGMLEGIVHYHPRVMCWIQDKDGEILQ